MKSAHYQKIFNSRRKAYPGGAAAYPDEYITDHEKPLFRPSHPKSLAKSRLGKSDMLESISRSPKSGPKLLFWKKQPKKRREMWFQDVKKDGGSYFINN